MKVFTGEFLGKQAALRDAHKKAFGTDRLPPGGYPDMGNGRLAAGLDYKDWFTFACAQRAHYNLIEWAATILLFILVAGVFYPTPAAAAGVAWIVGREAYSWGYVASGPGGRSVGAGIADLAALFLFGAAVNGCLGAAGLPSLAL
jgi:hypothetical protein